MLFLQIYKKGVLFFVETMNYSGENIELERNEEAKETQNIKNNIDTPHNEE